MIITHTLNAAGQRRVYLGSRGSLECWIEPKDDGVAWSFHLEPGSGSNPLPSDHMKAFAVDVLQKLAALLAVAAQDLAKVPFEAIAALHVANPLDFRRMPMPRRAQAEHGYMSTAPNITRPSADFHTHDFASSRFRRR
jgi:hypothetical protein